MGFIGFIACILIVFAVIFFAAIGVIKQNNAKRADAYVAAMRDAYETTGNVKESLKLAGNVLPEGSVERRGVEAAASYVERSIRKDYETAFRKVEAVMCGEEVSLLHQRILRTEIEAANKKEIRGGLLS